MKIETIIHDSLNQYAAFCLYRTDISFSTKPSLFLKTSMTWLKVTSERCLCVTDDDNTAARPCYIRRFVGIQLVFESSRRRVCALSFTKEHLDSGI